MCMQKEKGKKAHTIRVRAETESETSPESRALSQSICTRNHQVRTPAEYFRTLPCLGGVTTYSCHFRFHHAVIIR